MYHAVLLETLDTGAVWSVARSLARNIREYKALLANCDLTRRNDLDGRGTLSEVLHIWLGELPPKSGSILEALLHRGKLPRGDADTVLGTGERQARRIVSALLAKGAVVSESLRAPLRLALPPTPASRWMPGLFPEKADGPPQ